MSIKRSLMLIGIGLILYIALFVYDSVNVKDLKSASQEQNVILTILILVSVLLIITGFILVIRKLKSKGVIKKSKNKGAWSVITAGIIGTLIGIGMLKPVLSGEITGGMVYRGIPLPMVVVPFLLIIAGIGATLVGIGGLFVSD